MGLEQASDAELVAAVAAKDRGALRVLHQRHSPWLRARLLRRCGDSDVVAEAIQDTWMAVWKSPRWNGTGEVGAWVWGIAIRRLIGVQRRRNRWAPPTTRADEGIVVSAEDRVLLGVEHGDLAGALASLSPELRAVVQATVLDGLTTKEAAQLLGIARGTVKSRMSRARVELRGALA
ncbi:MAG: RNA polymerase sigma factor [Acidimicrobiia bacterium]|nr:RNA polymerase sigma factor [Acidimicrobiia bacterium]MDH5236663.1 RNA polymerase sigma factor [Acidimicrobiia bacterium]